MSESEFEGAVAPEVASESAPADVGPSGESFDQGMSAEDAAVLLGALNDLLEAEPAGVDEGQVRAYINAQLAPYNEFMAQQQQTAAVAKGQELLDGIVRDANAQLGSELDPVEVQGQAYELARAGASEVLAGFGWVPSQIEMAFAEDPSAPFKVLAHTWGVDVGAAARHAVSRTAELLYAESSRRPGPAGVLAKYRGAVPARRDSLLPAEQTEFIRKNVRAKGAR